MLPAQLDEEYQDVLRLRPPWSEAARSVQSTQDLARNLRQFLLQNGHGPSVRAAIAQMALSQSETAQCKLLLRYLAHYAKLKGIPPSLKLYAFTKWDAFSFDRFLSKSGVGNATRKSFSSLLGRIWDHGADGEQKIRQRLERERRLILDFRDRGFPEYQGIKLHESSPLPNPWRHPAKRAAPPLPRSKVRTSEPSVGATRKADWYAQRLAWKLRMMADRGVILSYTALAKYLTDEGFESPRGGRWTPTSARRKKDQVEAIYAKRR